MTTTRRSKMTHVRGPERERMAAQCATAYAGGMSIRQIASAHRRSFGFVRVVLLEAGVTLRPRGSSAGRLA